MSEVCMFIAFEGIDGSGKSSVARKIADALKERGSDIVFTAEPTTNELGSLLRTYKQDSFAEAMLFMADRAKHIHEMREQLKQDVLAGMMHDTALQQVAIEENIVVTKQEVTDAIKAEEVFHVNGAFNSEKFDQILRSNRMDRKYFINARTRELTKYKLLSLVETIIPPAPPAPLTLEGGGPAGQSLEQMLMEAKLNSARISYSEGLMSRYTISYNLDLLKGR